MAGWHHWLNGRESEWTPGDGDGQGGLVCCDSWGRKMLDTTEWLNWTEDRLEEKSMQILLNWYMYMGAFTRKWRSEGTPRAGTVFILLGWSNNKSVKNWQDHGLVIVHLPPVYPNLSWIQRVLGAIIESLFKKKNLFTAFRQKKRDPFLHLLKIIFMSKRHNLSWHILVSFNYVIGIVFNNDGPLRMMSLFIDHTVLYYFWISLI